MPLFGEEEMRFIGGCKVNSILSPTQNYVKLKAYLVSLYFDLLKAILLSKGLIYFLFLVLIHGVYDLKCQNPVILSNEKEILGIGRNLQIFQDPSARLTVNEVMRASYSGSFIPSNNDIPNFNVTSSTIWLRFQIQNKTQRRKWYLENSNAGVSISHLYFKTPEGGIKVIESGFLKPMNERDVSVRNPLYLLDLKKDSLYTFYIRLESISPLQAHFAIGTEEELMEQYQIVDLLNGAFFGLLFMLMIYNLFIYFSVKDKIYIYYLFYVVANFLFVAFVTGYSIYFPQAIAYVFQYHPAWVPFLLGGSSCLFGIMFLDMKHTYLRGYRISLGMLAILGLVPILDIIGAQWAAIILIQLLGLVFSIVCLTIGFIIWRKGYKPAKFYLLAWSFYLGGLFIYISADLFIIPYNDLTHNALEIGSALEAVLLSMAVGDKLSNFKKDKEIAQEESLEAARKNEKLVREQNVELERKVKERTQELSEQKDLVEEKNKEILDSINYAKRIQYTLLAHDEFLKKNLPEHFIYFQPKDIVSGDFYWATSVEASEAPNKKKLFYLAVCDSTGHGVPGAFMSLLNIGFLSEAINEKQIYKPNEVLDHVRKRLIESISADGQQDGFDGILLCIEGDMEKGEKMSMTYAAANNSPVLISGGEIKYLECDKMPVGKGVRESNFTLGGIKINKGDSLYLYTDGFADQFGGEKGKKFKYKNLNALLDKNKELSVSAQKNSLEKTFMDWKGAIEQVDDVCIIGMSFR
jgi:serine phosphatase RsbU (regulator of sigma subunit)